MFGFKYPSEYVVAVLFALAILSLIIIIISGTIIKVSQKKDKIISKGVSKLLLGSFVFFALFMGYVIIFMTIGDEDYNKAVMIAILCAVLVLYIMNKIKPKWGLFKKVLTFILAFALFLFPVVGILHWDGIVKHELYIQEKETAEKIAQEVRSKEIDNGLPLEKVVKASGYSYVAWSAYYSDYSEKFHITASCKKTEDAPYDETLRFYFIYNPITDDIDVDRIYDVDGTTYSREKSEQIFNELAEKELNDEK